MQLRVHHLASLLGTMCLLSVAIALSSASAATENSAPRGAVKGAAPHVVPEWFKTSFLEIQEDVNEATEANKQLMLFFQLNDCPYCDRMLTESFETDPYKSFIRKHFDVIAINVQGDREVVFSEEITVLEKALAELLQVRATPAILFLDSRNKQVMRVNGYRSPERFQQVLSYVSSKSYLSMSLADYLEQHPVSNVYALRDHELFREISDLSVVGGPLALILEDSGCHDCAEFHDRLLSRADVIDELRRFTVVRLNADSQDEIIDPAGKKTTVGELARRYGMTYRPGVMLFDRAKLIRRHDSLLYAFHFNESLRFVSGGFYKQLDYEIYKNRYREKRLSKGIDIDFSE